MHAWEGVGDKSVEELASQKRSLKVTCTSVELIAMKEMIVHMPLPEKHY